MSRRFFTNLAVVLPIAVQLLLMVVLAGALFGDHLERLLGRAAPASIDEEVRRAIESLVLKLRPEAESSANGDSLIFGAVGGLGFLVTFSLANIWATFVPILLARRRLVSVSQASASLVLTCVLFTISHSFVYQIGHICELSGPERLCYSGLDTAPHEIGRAIFLSATMMTSLGFGDYLPGDDIRLYVAAQSVAGLVAISAVIAMMTVPKRRLIHTRSSTPATREVEIKPLQLKKPFMR